jgi:hypothetical protein
MDRLAKVLAGLLGRSARLLPAARRDWAEAVLAEAGEIPAGLARLAWLGGGLWVVTREVLTRAVRVLAFAAGAAGLVWAGWPGSSSDSAVPLNRVYVVVTVVALAVLPAVVRRYLGPARGGWVPRAARVGGYALVLALIAAKAVKDRAGSKLGAYFVLVPGIWAMEILLLLVIAAYAAGLLVLTSQRVRLARWTLPIGIGLGAATAGVLYALAPLGAGVDPSDAAAKWWGLAALALPLATGFLAARLPAPDTRPAALDPVRRGALAATCAMATAALLLAVLTSVTIALFPHHVPLQFPAPPAGGGCETCDPNQVVIPPGLRHEYWAELSVGQAGMTPLMALMLAPFLGAWLGVLGGELARKLPGTRLPGTRRRGASGPRARSAPQPPGRLVTSGDDRDQAVDTHATAALTADIPAGRPRPEPVCEPARGPSRQPAGRAVTWSAFGLVALALFAATLAVPGPTPGDDNPAALILFLATVVYLIAWLAAGAQLLDNWRRQRPRPGAGRELTEPGPPAVSE